MEPPGHLQRQAQGPEFQLTLLLYHLMWPMRHWLSAFLQVQGQELRLIQQRKRQQQEQKSFSVLLP